MCESYTLIVSQREISSNTIKKRVNTTTFYVYFEQVVCFNGTASLQLINKWRFKSTCLVWRACPSIEYKNSRFWTTCPCFFVEPRCFAVIPSSCRYKSKEVPEIIVQHAGEHGTIFTVGHCASTPKCARRKKRTPNKNLLLLKSTNNIPHSGQLRSPGTSIRTFLKNFCRNPVPMVWK